MDEEDEHSPSEFYYPEDLETFDAETETGITRMPYNKQLTNRAGSGSQAGVADINHAFHLYYKCCMWIEFQSIST